MRSKMNRGLIILLLTRGLAGGAVTGTMFAADAKREEGVYRLSQARGPIRPVDLSPFKGSISSEILASPANGLESAFIIYTRMGPAAAPRGLYTLPVDHTYLVLSGKLKVQIGTDQFVAEPETLVLIPAGIPHQAWNADSMPEADFEVITPAPSSDLASLIKPAQPRKIENAAQYLRVAPPMQLTHSGIGAGALNERVLADRSTGSEHMLERLDDVTPGSGRGELHMHPFDQVYFIRKGEMTLRYGMETYKAEANSLVVLHAGTVHSNMNNTSELESHITLMLPQPPQGTAAGVDLEILKGQGGAPPPNK